MSGHTTEHLGDKPCSLADNVTNNKEKGECRQGFELKEAELEFVHSIRIVKAGASYLADRRPFQI